MTTGGWGLGVLLREVSGARKVMRRWHTMLLPVELVLLQRPRDGCVIGDRRLHRVVPIAIRGVHRGSRSCRMPTCVGFVEPQPLFGQYTSVGVELNCMNVLASQLRLL